MLCGTAANLRLLYNLSVNPSVSSVDGDAATGSFKDGVISCQEGRLDGDVQREGGRQRRDEGCVQQPARHVAQQAMEFAYLARVARGVLAIPATQAQSERMCSTVGLTVNKTHG